MTDSKSLTRFFQTKIVPPPLWNACDYALHFKFTIAHNAGKKNTAADFLSRSKIDANEDQFLKIRKDVPTQPIDVTIQSTRIVQKDQVFFQTNGAEMPSEGQLW